MARALSQVYTQIRGSVGGVTYLANQYHQIVCRARTSPVDPSTTAQNQVRQAFSGAAVDWLAFTDAQRSDWDDYADSLTYPNPLGDQSLTGRLVAMGNLAFMRYIYARGETLTTSLKTAPTTPGFLSLDPLSIGIAGAASTGFTVNVGNPNPEDISAFIWTSRIFNATRNTYKGPWRTNSMTKLDITAASTGNQAFVQGADGDIVFVYIRAIVDDGLKRISQPAILRAVVTSTI